MEPLLYLIFGSLLAYTPLILFDRWTKRQRLKALRQAAARLELAFSLEDVEQLPERLARFALFKLGQDGRVVNVMRNDDGVWLFEYNYRLPGRFRHNRRYQTVIYFRREEMALPRFRLQPAGLLPAIMRELGHLDKERAGQLSLPIHPDLETRYQLNSPEPSLMPTLFHAALVANLAADPGPSIEGQGGDLIFYYDQKRVEPKEIDAFFAQARQRAALIFVDSFRR